MILFSHKKTSIFRDGGIDTRDRPLVPRSGITSAAGLLTYGSTFFDAFPYLSNGTVTGFRRAEELPSYSGGPVPELHRLSYYSWYEHLLKSGIAPGHRTLFCFHQKHYVIGRRKSTMQTLNS